MITRREFIAGAGALVGSAAAIARDTRTFTAADVHVEGYPTVVAVRSMGERIAELTNGRLQIKVYHSGQLGRESDTVDLARFGALDITRVNFAALNNPFPLTGVFCWPYLFDSVAHMRRCVDSQIGAAVLKGFESRGLIGLAIYDAGARSFYNVRRPIHEPRDLHGLKIRVPPSDIFIDLVRALGANPTPLSYGEVYSALQTHLIEGAENNWRTFDTSRQFEVARYWSDTAHSYSPEALLMSARTFNALSDDDKHIVLSAARDSVNSMRVLWDRLEIESRDRVLAAGVKRNDVDMDAFRRHGESVVARYLHDAQLASLYERIRSAA
ncbi:MAG TPA: TRAP transporter substrate-binding protein [Steroidobacteraceae bacterium]|nr:TRAP transporter substrate-binding protein [Steroidobacteraceae bacterium]